MQNSDPTLYCTKICYHLYIPDPFWWSTKNVDCFNLVWNTQISKWTIFFFECPGKMFLIIEKVLEKKSEDQP